MTLKITNNQGKNIYMPILVKDLPSSDEKKRCLFVPWGYYYMSNVPSSAVGTDALASCFAYIRRWNNCNNIFFAHVSDDSETRHVIANLLVGDEVKKEDLSSIIVLGKNPTPQTEGRVKAVIEASKCNHVVLRTKTGAVTYTIASGAVDAPESLDKINIVKGMRLRMESKGSPLQPIDESSLHLEEENFSGVPHIVHASKEGQGTSKRKLSG